MKLKRMCVFFIIFLLTFTNLVLGDKHLGFSNKELSIIVGPYPQNSNLDSIKILWETNIETSDNHVHYGLTPECSNSVSCNNYDFYHEIRLNSLTPSTKYFYKIVSEGVESDIFSFYTAFDEKEDIKFIAYGDSRGVWDNWTSAEKVAYAIEGEQSFFVLHTGDLVHNGTIKNEWVDFFKVSNFVHNSTLYPSLGNHERNGEPYFKYFSLPNNELWYSFDSGPVHFVCMDSNFRNSFRPTQFLWLIKDLSRNTKPFTIVFFHHPPFSSGNDGSTKYLRWIWGVIFEFYNVDIVFNGHDHSYEHGKIGNVNYVVTGGGGAPLYDVGQSWWTIYSEKTLHYCVVSVDQFELTFKAKKPDGSIIDTFKILKIRY